MRRLMRRYWFHALVVVAGIAVLAAVFYSPKEPPKPREVRVLYPKIVASLPHFVAQKKGIYQKYNLSVKADPVAKSPDMIDGVRMNKVDFLPAVSLVDTVNVSIDEATPVLVIVSHSRMKKDIPFDCLLVTPGSKLASLKELAGHTVGVFPGGTSEASIRWYLQSEGIDLSQIKFVPVAPREQIDALLAGRVDAVHAYEPERTLGVRQYQCRLLSPSIYAAMTEPCPIGCTAISAKFLREQPDVAADMLKAWDEAIDYIRANEKEARALLTEELKYPREVADNCTWVDATRSNEVDNVCLTKFILQLQQVQPPQIRGGTTPSGLIHGK